MTRLAALMRTAIVLLACILPLAACQQAYPQPRGDPSASSAPRRKHALVELLEQSAPAVRPARDWRPPDLRAWLGQESLAAALGLAPVESVQLPLYVNVFTLGFEDGTGGGGIQLSSTMLREWLASLENIVPQHVLRPQEGAAAGAQLSDDAEQELEHTSTSRRSSRRRGMKDANVDTADPHDPAGLHVNYRYHLRLVQLSPRVLRVIERFLSVHHRTDDPRRALFQVDGEILSGALEALVAHLQLNDAYNIFVLNPARDWLGPPPPEATLPLVSTYGYRAGLGPAELDELAEPTDPALKRWTEDWRTKEAASWSRSFAKEQADGPEPVPFLTPREADDGTAQPQLQLLDHVAASDKWAAGVLAAPHALGPQSLLAHVKQQSAHHPAVLRSSSVSDPFASADCLVDTWVSRGRTLFVDLSAGPAEWGPVVGGEGVKSAASLPSLATFASARARERDEQESTGEDDYLRNGYDAAAVRAERIVLLDLLDAQCGGAGRPRSSDDTDAGRSSENSAACKDIEAKLRALDAYEAANAPGKDGGAKAQPTAASADRSASLSFFHDDDPNAPDAGANSGHNASIEVDRLLAHVSATLASAMRHALTPAVGSTRSSGGYSAQVQFNLYTLVNHQQYDPLMGGELVARLKYGLEQLRLPSQTFVYSVHKLTMDDDAALSMAYAGALRSAVVPSLSADGHFSAKKRLYLDSALLRSSLAKIDVEAKAEHDTLFGQANRAAHSAASAAAAASVPRTRTISIFLFSLDFPLPVLIDKHFQSQALPDANMVVAVQSNLHLWESPLACNHKPLFWNLRDPVRAILRSTATVLGGLLPSHVQYSRAHARASQDWLWATGLSPMSLTSTQGMEFSRTQIDALQRNYVLTAMRAAAHKVNEQLLWLARQKPTLSNRMLAGIDDVPISSEEIDALNLTSAVGSGGGGAPSLRSVSGRFSARTLQLQVSYGSFVDLLSGELVSGVGELDFDAACRRIDELHRRAHAFATLVNELSEWNTRDACVNDDGQTEAALAARYNGGGGGKGGAWWAPHLPVPVWLAAGCLCCALVLYRVLVRRPRKTHLN